MQVFAAFRSSPDYHSSGRSLVSLHQTFGGAKKALFPDKDYHFVQSPYRKNTFTGPDGFGEIERMEIKP